MLSIIQQKLKNLKKRTFTALSIETEGLQARERCEQTVLGIAPMVSLENGLGGSDGDSLLELESFNDYSSHLCFTL